MKWKEIFDNHISDKKLIFTVYKELTVAKIQITQLKNRQMN